jgi:prevent-host-death family protein
METIKVSEFKEKFLHIIDEVNQTGKQILITKNGKPVSILQPYRTAPPRYLDCIRAKYRAKTI